MDDQPQIRVLLLSDGQVKVPEGEFMPGVGEATWEVLGQIRHDGEQIAFARRDGGGDVGGTGTESRARDR